MMRIHLLLLLFALLTSGCAHRVEPEFKPGEGDVRQFILSEAVQRGGIPVATNRMPSIPGAWRYKKDEFGVIIRLPRRSYGQVEKFVVSTFGQLRIGPSKTENGGMLGLYRLSPKGGGLTFEKDAKYTQVIVIGPVTAEQIIQRLPEVLKELEQEKTR